METFLAGTTAGAGSFRCEDCGFAVALQENDAIPSCPSCTGSAFRRAALFEETTIEVRPAPEPEAEVAEWLDDARDALVEAGDYVAFEDDDRVRVIPLQDGWTRVGRSLSAHVRIDDPTVSRRHALIYRDQEGAKVLDDRSLNGVFCNGDRVELSELDDGDAIAVGRFTLHFIRFAGDRESAHAAV